MNNIFRFKKFHIKQSNEVFKVGTDGVLAGCLANISQAQKILDIGTGTGLLALICAQRNPAACISAIDSEMESYLLAQENFSNSPFSNLSVSHKKIQDLSNQEYFDYIICNPPYFKVSEQLHQKYPVARHQLKMDYKVLLIKMSKLLTPSQGIAGLIFPYEQENEIIKLAESAQLSPIRVVHIYGIKNGKVKRSFIEFSLTPAACTNESLYIEETPRIWTSEYKTLTEDFYL
ncbi:methyltransferase [Apibacter raozihei]|uniref:tRNA1(Val) (adenine(37)-N6)-methyltransferase n=1 Tax=Apibacter TaxID=1778601 RepID=UPI000FE2B8DA|nr:MULTISPECIES: methyltransferase [Apibacter]